jgi:hypothetical protein
MDFEHLDLVPMANADEILDRWTRPYLNMSTASVPKAFPPYTIQYITRILKSYVSGTICILAIPAGPWTISVQSLTTIQYYIRYRLGRTDSTSLIHIQR